MFENIIDEFMPDADPGLREYLKKEPISDWDAADIVFYAIAPVEKKREALLQLEEMELPEEQKSDRDYWPKYRKSIEAALEYKDSKDAVFVVYEYSIYDDDIESDEWMHGIFASYEAAKAFADKDRESKKDEDMMSWYVIELWKRGENDAYVETCSYYIIDGELCYTEFKIGDELHNSCTDGELRIPVSYKPGDIFIADRYPFGQKVKFVMMEIGDNQDCCCLQALSKREDQGWDVGAVKHGMVGDIGYPRVSVLYTAKKYEPDLSDFEDRILAKMSELIDGEEATGAAIWDKLAFHEIADDERMMEFLNNWKKA